MGLYDDASLIFLPSAGAGKDTKAYSVKPTDGTGDFTFSRGSNLSATRVGPDGLIEKGRENKFLQSNNFTTSWTTVNLTLTSGETGYDGTNDAWKFLPSGAPLTHFLYQNVTGGGIVTFSIYAKAAGYPGLFVYSDNSFAGKYFNVENGTLGDDYGSPIDSSITSVGNGWYRCTVTVLHTSGNFNVFVSPDGVNTYGMTADGTSAVLVQDAQMEGGLVVTDYIESGASKGTAGLLENEPRFDYSGGATCPALLLEPQRTNEVIHSEYGGGYTAIDSNITKTDNATTSPEGVDNAVKLEGITGSGGNQVVNFGGLNGTSVVNRTFTGSVYIKPVNPSNVGQDITLSLQRNGGDFEALNLVVEIDSADWKRYDLTYTFTGAGAADQTGCVFKILRQSSTIDDVYLYGAQLEEGSYATSYIPTYGSAVTRNIDNMQIASGISDLLPQGTGTIYVEATIVDAVDTESYLMRIEQASFSNTIFIARSTAGNLGAYYRDGNSTLFSMQKNNVADTFKAAFAFESGNSVFYVNGEQIGTSSVTYTPSVTYDDIRIGGYSVSTANMSGLFSQALVFKTRLSNEELAALTTI